LPELPEVENIAQGLRLEIVGLCIESICVNKVAILRGPYRRSWRRAVGKLTGLRVSDVTRRGKRLIINTEKGLSILIQLGMTGKVLINQALEPKEKHSHFLINFNNNKQLRFVDPRRFGRVWFLDTAQADNIDQVMEDAGLGRMGPEALDITQQQFRQILTANRPIKSLLLDQTRIAGLGNIYTDEALFRARIHPATHAGAIKSKQANKLRSSICAVLTQAIKHGGTSFSDYRNAYGARGSFLKWLKVYQRKDLPCPRCGCPIAAIKIAGRSSHFCPSCQRQK